MAKGKYLRKPSTAKTLNFKMPRQYKQRILALIGAGLTFASMNMSNNSFAVQASASEVTPSAPIVTIGVANDGAEITVDGKSYEIDENSFVFVADGEALAFDIHGNILKGEMNIEDYREIKQMTEEEMSHYDIRQVCSISPAKIRTSGEINNDNIISTVPSGDYVLAYQEKTPENDKEWLKTLTSDGTEGFMREDVIREVNSFEEINDITEKNMESAYFVNTSGDSYVDLKLRSSPQTGTTENIVTKIPHGSLVQHTGVVHEENNRTWATVRYRTPDGTRLDGWVVEGYLTQEMVPEKPVAEEDKLASIKNASGGITGIDISGMKPSQLRKLFESEIPKTAQTPNGNFDTSKLAGGINYVYMKLGASGYAKGDLSIRQYDAYKEQVAICEEFGVPYGFYYYSTAITVEEAQKELECIQQRIEELKELYDMKNNKFEIAVDFELSTASDRQYGGDIMQKTEAKAALINGIQELGLSDNVLIYGPARVMKSNDGDQIVNMQYLRSLLKNPDSVKLWLCSHIYGNGNFAPILEKDIKYLEEQGFSTVMIQAVLDVKINDGAIDINNMIDTEHFSKLTSQVKSDQSVNIDKVDDGR